MAEFARVLELLFWFGMPLAPVCYRTWEALLLKEKGSRERVLSTTWQPVLKKHASWLQVWSLASEGRAWPGPWVSFWQAHISRVARMLDLGVLKSPKRAKVVTPSKWGATTRGSRDAKPFSWRKKRRFCFKILKIMCMLYQSWRKSIQGSVKVS